MARNPLLEKSVRRYEIDDEDFRRGGENFREIYIDENFRRANDNFEELYISGGGTGGAPLDSPVFTGTPRAPTAIPGTNTTQIATTAFAAAALALKASIAQLEALGSDDIDNDSGVSGATVSNALNALAALIAAGNIEAYKDPVQAATTANITIATALNNGDVIDGVTLVTNDRVLVWNQTTGSQNGIWVVGASPARATDFDETVEVTAGSSIPVVSGGTLNGGKLFLLATEDPITVGTTALTFIPIGGTGTSDVGSFVDLDDVPASYTGQGGKFVRVTDLETGLEFSEALEPPIIQDLQPDPFTFTPVVDAVLGQLYESNTITVSGITPGATVYVVVIGGLYSKNGGAYTSVQGTAVNGTVLRVRRNAATFNGIQVTVTLSVGGPDNMRSGDFRITTIAVEDENGMWSPGADIIARDFNHNSVPTGPVQAWLSGGFWPKTAQTSNGVAAQPVKLAEGGVKFSKGTRQALQWAADSRNTLLDRWGVLVVAADLVGNPNVGNIAYGSIDGWSGGVAFRHPTYHFNATAGVFKAGIRTYHFDDAGNPVHAFHDVIIPNGSITAKHLVVWYRRENMMFVRVDGVPGTPQFYGAWLNASESITNASILGSNLTNHLADVILYRTISGQGEHTEAWFDKLEGWAHHAHGTVALPGGHPYFAAAPVGLDADDAPYHWEFDEVEWTAWKTEMGSGTDLGTAKFAERGEPEQTPTGFEIVFFEDFKTDPLVNNYSGPKGSSLYCPINPPTTIHHNAGALAKSSLNYVFDHTGDGTLALRLVQHPTIIDGRTGNRAWTSGSFQSVNTNGVGRTWNGHCFREIRMKFPLMAAPRPGFFPAWWAYNEESYFWQTRPRLEWDWWEADGLDGRYYNQTLHLHEGNVEYDAEEYIPPSQAHKLTGYSMSVANFGTLIDIYDGEFHLWKEWSDPGTDLTYISVDGLEVVRMPTLPLFLERWNLLVDWAYREVQGLAVEGASYDMTIDYVRISKLTTELAAWAPPFTARPTLAGAPSTPNTLTLNPRITSSQLQVHWYRSGVPVVASTDDLSYVLSAPDIGHTIRASVRAMDLLNQPEAWTANTATIS